MPRKRRIRRKRVCDHWLRKLAHNSCSAQWGAQHLPLVRCEGCTGTISHTIGVLFMVLAAAGVKVRLCRLVHRLCGQLTFALVYYVGLEFFFFALTVTIF